MAKNQKDKKLTMVDTIIHRQTENIMAKKQKDKKINNGRHNNTQTDNIMAKKQMVEKINNGRHNNTQTNRQYNGQETKG
jgi:hypothetical protein